MPLHRTHRQIAAWAAAMALLVAMLAPGLAQALAAAAGATGHGRPGWVQVCTAQGAVWVAGGPAGAGGPAQHPSPAQVDPFEHCPFCPLHGQPLALPPAAAPAWQPALLTHGLPTTAAAAPDTLQPWRDGQARAPPGRC